MVCDRCGGPLGAHTMSKFNTQTICMGCKERERAHPKYPEACAAEEADLKRTLALGIPNHFPGIGLPADLKVRAEDPLTTSELIHIREMLLELEAKYPEVLYDGILRNLDLSNGFYEEIMLKLGKLTA